jgi:hypothetical protein
VNRRIKIYPDEVTHYSEIFYAVQNRSPHGRIGRLNMAVYSIGLCHDVIWSFYRFMNFKFWKMHAKRLFTVKVRFDSESNGDGDGGLITVKSRRHFYFSRV